MDSEVGVTDYDFGDNEWDGSDDITSHRQQGPAKPDSAWRLCDGRMQLNHNPLNLSQLLHPHGVDGRIPPEGLLGFCFISLVTRKKKENLCLYGLPNETWEVTLPVEEVPPELPEPALGVNLIKRPGETDMGWNCFISVLRRNSKSISKQKLL